MPLHIALRQQAVIAQTLRQSGDERGDGELAHEGVTVMSYLLGFAPEGMEASELNVRVINTM